jgi:DNA mismatch repair protein MutS2
VLDRVARHCHGELAARLTRELRPETAFDAACARMQRTREAMRLNEEAPLPTARVESLDEALERVALGSSVDGRELFVLGQVLELAEQLRRYLARHAELAPNLVRFLATSPELSGLHAEIQRCIAPDGSVLDGASPALARARRQAGDLRDDLRQRLQRLLGRLGEAVQGQYVAERDGRYVLPIRADAPFRVEGFVLGSSASGSTLYVEPTETHELGNRVQRAEAEVRVEEARVLTELSAAVGALLPAVRQAAQACVQADCLRALALYARHCEALPFEPAREPRLELRAMRHPLLVGEGQPVVANDLSLQSGRALVLSGPNAGGKTVGLKCLGLAAWMVRSGIPIPAGDGSVVGFFEPVLSDIGDHQSLSSSLSTFSAHVRHLGQCLTLAGPRSLVLVDELAGGTDPDEGAALASALSEALLERGAALCVTTHYERLKALAAEDERMQNAAVGFDRERLAPTFHIEYGAPGASSAFLVARRHGVPETIVDRAEQLLPDALLESRALNRQLDEQRERHQAAAAGLEAEQREVASLREQLAHERRRSEREERDQLGREAQALLAEVREARSRLREAERRLSRSTSDAGALRDAKRATNEAARFVSIDGKLTRATSSARFETRSDDGAVAWESLAVGARVRVVERGQKGEVLTKPKRDQVTVGGGAV